MKQRVLKASKDYRELDKYLDANGIRSAMLVCGGSVQRLGIYSYFAGLEKRKGIRIVKFSGFRPNPVYESVTEGVRLFRDSGCECMIAVGGGSTIDVAKCIRLWSGMDGDGAGGGFLRGKAAADRVRLLAVPTTAGSGSEATRYAVVYYNGEKQSVSHESILPDAVLLDSSTLRTLPVYYKKSAMLDALCHGVESYWSVNSTDESREYAARAIRLIIDNKEGYLDGDEGSARRMLEAAYDAGKAINIAQTAAGHAMCYKLTGLYGIAHGHAAALCVSEFWPWIIANTDRCTDLRRKQYLETSLAGLAEIFGCKKPAEAAERFRSIVKELDLKLPEAEEKDFSILRSSVNPVRMKNSPAAMTEEELEALYRRMLGRRMNGNES